MGCPVAPKILRETRSRQPGQDRPGANVDELQAAQLDAIHGQVEYLSAAMRAVLARLGTAAQWEASMSAEIDRIKTSVTQLTSVTQGAVTLLGQLAQRVRDLQADPAALTALADEVDARKAELAGAIQANTPAAGGGGGTSPTPGTPPPPTPPAPPAPPTPGGT
jgi:chromosome segregation ATPase